MTALWQRYENRQVQPTAPAPEVQAQVSSLEKEVAALKALIQSRDEELAARDLTISEERSANARLKKEVMEANERYTRSVASLSTELDRADQLSSRLSAVQNECYEACKNALNAEAEKDKLKAEVERLEAERNKAVKAQDHLESLLIRLRARYDAGQAKLKRYLKQLSYVLFLRDQSWARGCNWGFENFQTLVTNSKYKFDPETVGPQLVGFPEEAILEMDEFGKEFMPDVPSWGDDAPDPRKDPLDDPAS
jgi:chromosome segregation ATPase